MNVYDVGYHKLKFEHVAYRVFGIFTNPALNNSLYGSRPLQSNPGL